LSGTLRTHVLKVHNQQTQAHCKTHTHHTHSLATPSTSAKKTKPDRGAKKHRVVRDLSQGCLCTAGGWPTFHVTYSRWQCIQHATCGGRQWPRPANKNTLSSSPKGVRVEADLPLLRTPSPTFQVAAAATLSAPNTYSYPYRPLFQSTSVLLQRLLGKDRTAGSPPGICETSPFRAT